MLESLKEISHRAYLVCVVPGGPLLLWPIQWHFRHALSELWRQIIGVDERVRCGQQKGHKGQEQKAHRRNEQSRYLHFCANSPLFSRNSVQGSGKALVSEIKM